MPRNDVDTEYFYHYFEKDRGPFVNLSDLDMSRAHDVLDGIRRQNDVFASHRYPGYLERRRELEQIARDIFVSKNGNPQREVPQYMVIGKCPWLETWYKEARYIRVHVTEFDLTTVSFSYGDLFPTFSPRVTDDKEYRRQVYTYDEIVDLMGRYGLPQSWNADGRFGPERYIEVQVWSDRPVEHARSLWDVSS